MSPPSGHGTSRPKHSGWMSQFLRKEAEEQTALLEGLRARLIKRLENQANPAELPDEDWCRVARLYQDGYRTLAHLELETAKVRLLADRARDKGPMSDEQFAAQMDALGRQAMQGLSDDEFALEQRRRAQLQAGMPAKERSDGNE